MIDIGAVLAALSDSTVPVVTFGMQQLDRAVRGLMPGTLWVVTGRPREGRTMFSMQIARRAAELGVPAQVLAGTDPLTYYAALLASGAGDLPLNDVLRGERPTQSVASLPIMFTTPRHTSLHSALRDAPDHCVLVLDDADRWDGDALHACRQVSDWLTPTRAAVVTVPRQLVSPERHDWQQWVRYAEVVIEIEMGSGPAVGDAYITVLSNRSGPVTSVAGQGMYSRAQFVDFDS